MDDDFLVEFRERLVDFLLGGLCPVDAGVHVPGHDAVGGFAVGQGCGELEEFDEGGWVGPAGEFGAEWGVGVFGGLGDEVVGFLPGDLGADLVDADSVFFA
ncbi:hypothetical protein KIH79_06715 [Bifidobacterium sp. 82T10]|uniref:Uncharacterized protein n=1 Tax=Bifidobacterium miconis TaxID=2834435 RepID=A0ABS6WFC1_9BIFI|nr:hypothetical protein [Bifidobacterium miconis]MBW3092642.1 hypothetical protein [Bifidobacterium miconis]